MMHNKFSKLTLMLLPLIACGGDSKSKVDSGVHLVDSSGSGSGSNVACTASADYATLPDAGSAQSATNHPATAGSGGHPQYITYIGKMNNDTSPDFLDIELYAGYGAFAGSNALSNKTVQLTGAETSYKDCGACVLILTDVHQQGSGAAETDDYMATGGTLTVTSTSGSNFQASLSNVTFAHVNIGSDGTTTAVGDCNAHIGGDTINTPLKVGSAAIAPFSATYEGQLIGSHLVLRNRIQ